MDSEMDNRAGVSFFPFTPTAYRSNDAMILFPWEYREYSSLPYPFDRKKVGCELLPVQSAEQHADTDDCRILHSKCRAFANKLAVLR